MKYFVKTLGCKVNSYESGAVGRLLEGMGYERSSAKDADVIYVNTCAVTGEGERKSRQAVRHLRQTNPNAFLMVYGCASEKDRKAYAEMGADLVGGTYPKFSFPEYLGKGRPEEAIILEGDPKGYRAYEEAGLISYGEKTRAFLKVQDGCDAYCAYCLVPYLRGHSRSREPEKVFEEARLLAGLGYKEIVLTGIHLGMYGRDIGFGSFGRLVKELLDTLPSDVRIRVGSLESNEVDEIFLETLKNSDGRLCPHVHMPLQSGCSRTLKAMGRPYDTEEYLRKAEAIRAAVPGAAIAADLILGFPGETEEDFQESLAFVEKAKISFLHAFPYSPRPGTKAAGLKNAVSHEIAKKRARAAIALGNILNKEYLDSLSGLRDEVLVEEVGEDGAMYGHSGRFAYCRVERSQGQKGSLVRGIYGDNLKPMGDL